MCETERVPNEFWEHHGNLSKEIREEAEAALKDSTRPATAICTSTLELGIDIGRVKSIAQIGTPNAVASLRQRLGRSGRRGAPAVLRTYIRESEIDANSSISYGRRDGVAVIAEGLVEGLDPSELEGLQDVERDTHGNVRIAEVNIGEILKAAVQQRLKEFGIKTTIVAKNIGYELRCADPIPFDLEYTRDLGYCATKCLLSGGHSVMISMQGGRFVPIPFEKLINPSTGRAKVRMVDIHSTHYAIARRYMLRLRRDDFED